MFYIAAFIILFAFLVRATIGFGSGLIAVSSLSLFYKISYSVPLVFLLDFLGGLALGAYDFKSIKYKEAIYVAPASIGGLIVGAYILKHANAQHVTAFLGIFIILYIIYALTVKPENLPLIRSFWGIPLGFLGGLLGSLYGGGGPPIVAFLQMRHLDKRSFRATFQLITLIDNIFRGSIYFYLGFFTKGVLKEFLMLSPFVFIGLFIGNKLHFKINEKMFFYLTLGVLFLTALKLISKQFGY